jgi:hypothetical protein
MRQSYPDQIVKNTLRRAKTAKEAILDRQKNVLVCLVKKENLAP